MNTVIQPDAWIRRTMVVLGFIVAASVVGVIILAVIDQPVSDFLSALGLVALGGLTRLFISPLNQVLSQ